MEEEKKQIILAEDESIIIEFYRKLTPEKKNKFLRLLKALRSVLVNEKDRELSE